MHLLQNHWKLNLLILTGNKREHIKNFNSKVNKEKQPGFALVAN